MENAGPREPRRVAVRVGRQWGHMGVMVDITHVTMAALMMAVGSAMLANPQTRCSFPFSLGILSKPGRFKR